MEPEQGQNFDTGFDSELAQTDSFPPHPQSEVEGQILSGQIEVGNLEELCREVVEHLHLTTALGSNNQMIQQSNKVLGNFFNRDDSILVLLHIIATSKSSICPKINQLNSKNSGIWCPYIYMIELHSRCIDWIGSKLNTGIGEVCI